MPHRPHHRHYTHMPAPSQSELYNADSTRLEAVAVCVGFDDILDYTLEKNHHHLDTMIIVTSHDDRDTQAVCHKH